MAIFGPSRPNVIRSEKVIKLAFLVDISCGVWPDRGSQGIQVDGQKRSCRANGLESCVQDVVLQILTHFRAYARAKVQWGYEFFALGHKPSSTKCGQSNEFHDVDLEAFSQFTQAHDKAMKDGDSRRFDHSAAKHVIPPSQSLKMHLMHMLSDLKWDISHSLDSTSPQSRVGWKSFGKSSSNQDIAMPPDHYLFVVSPNPVNIRELACFVEGQDVQHLDTMLQRSTTHPKPINNVRNYLDASKDAFLSPYMALSKEFSARSVSLHWIGTDRSDGMHREHDFSVCAALRSLLRFYFHGSYLTAQQWSVSQTAWPVGWILEHDLDEYGSSQPDSIQSFVQSLALEKSNVRVSCIMPNGHASIAVITRLHRECENTIDFNGMTMTLVHPVSMDSHMIEAFADNTMYECILESTPSETLASPFFVQCIGNGCTIDFILFPFGILRRIISKGQWTEGRASKSCEQDMEMREFWEVGKNVNSALKRYLSFRQSQLPFDCERRVHRKASYLAMEEAYNLYLQNFQPLGFSTMNETSRPVKEPLTVNEWLEELKQIYYDDIYSNELGSKRFSQLNIFKKLVKLERGTSGSETLAVQALGQLLPQISLNALEKKYQALEEWLCEKMAGDAAEATSISSNLDGMNTEPATSSGNQVSVEKYLTDGVDCTMFQTWWRLSGSFMDEYTCRSKLESFKHKEFQVSVLLRLYIRVSQQDNENEGTDANFLEIELGPLLATLEIQFAIHDSEWFLDHLDQFIKVKDASLAETVFRKCGLGCSTDDLLQSSPMVPVQRSKRRLSPQSYASTTNRRLQRRLSTLSIHEGQVLRPRDGMDVEADERRTGLSNRLRRTASTPSDMRRTAADGCSGSSDQVIPLGGPTGHIVPRHHAYRRATGGSGRSLFCQQQRHVVPMPSKLRQRQQRRGGTKSGDARPATPDARSRRKRKPTTPLRVATPLSTTTILPGKRRRPSPAKPAPLLHLHLHPSATAAAHNQALPGPSASAASPLSPRPASPEGAMPRTTTPQRTPVSRQRRLARRRAPSRHSLAEEGLGTGGGLVGEWMLAETPRSARRTRTRYGRVANLFSSAAVATSTTGQAAVTMGLGGGQAPSPHAAYDRAVAAGEGRPDLGDGLVIAETPENAQPPSRSPADRRERSKKRLFL